MEQVPDRKGEFLKPFGSPEDISGLSGSAVCLHEKNSDQTGGVLDLS